MLGQAPAERPHRRDQGKRRAAAHRLRARYLADETYRRRIARQLNKGENLHALRRSLAYAGEGALRRRHHEQQTEQMWCLTLATNAIVTWTTEYHGLAVAALRRGGRHIDDEVLPPSGPATTRTSTSTEPTPSTSTASWPSWTPTATGRCAAPQRRPGPAPKPSPATSPPPTPHHDRRRLPVTRTARLQLIRSYVIQGKLMLAVTWASLATLGEASLCSGYMRLSGAAIWSSVDDQLGITPRAPSDSSGYIFATQNSVSAAYIPFSSDTPT